VRGDDYFRRIPAAVSGWLAEWRIAPKERALRTGTAASSWHCLIRQGLEKTMRLRVFVAIAFLLACAPARAAPPEEAFEQRVAELLRWIAAHSDYPPAVGRLPAFVFLAPDTIRHTFTGAAMGYTAEMSDVRAALVRGTIYLPDTFTLGRDDYMLLHELVHHLQDESGKDFACLALREREAYELQTRFVEETGRGEAPNDMFMLMLRCDIR
jgi:hypothetical protein